jgi:NAD(P)-dependent dehydrogenase (short-subunit alcohol dehydrogenase family)
VAALESVRKAAGDHLDGLVACAGVGPTVQPWTTIISLNYFGAQALLEGLRDLLAVRGRAAAVAVSSNSSTLPGMDTPLVEACLVGNEEEARRLALTMDGTQTYCGSKLALARWVRRSAPTPSWAGSGIRLNAVAPGAVLTPLLQVGLDDPQYGPAIRAFPVPLGGFGAPDQIAATIEFLLGPDAAFFCGSVVFVDGGTDAMIRPDAF